YETPTSDEKVKAVLSGIRRSIISSSSSHRAASYETVIAIEQATTSLSALRHPTVTVLVMDGAVTAGKLVALSVAAIAHRALRNRAIILLGFAGAFRRSELVALNVEDLEETAEGMLVTLRRSKTDQEGFGRRVAIPRGEIVCPVAALRQRAKAQSVERTSF